MKKQIVIIAALFLGYTSFGQKKKDLINEVAQLKTQLAEMKSEKMAMEKASEVHMEDELHKLSYSLGVSIGNSIKSQGLDSISYTAFTAALEDIMKGTEKMSIEECQRFVQTSFVKINEERIEKLKAEGETFLAANGKRPEVVTTESGLQYEIMKKGEGAIPTSSDKVKVHYHGTLINGKVFDSSVDRGKPTSFRVTQVIKGWIEALQLMPVGSKWKLFIPQNLAYGERSAAGGVIKPYSALVFEVELLGIE